MSILENLLLLFLYLLYICIVVFQINIFQFNSIVSGVNEYQAVCSLTGSVNEELACGKWVIDR